MFAVVVGVVILACLGLAFILAYAIAGPRTIRHFGHDLRWEPCKNCTAGTQWWDGKRWGAIPEHARRVSDGVFTIEPPQANVRKHPACLGSPGGHWVDRNGAQNVRRPNWRDAPRKSGDSD